MTIGMKNVATTAALVGIAFVFATSAALAQAKPQAKVDLGAFEYKSSCAACHGVTGKGDGPLRPRLVIAPSDLTTIAKRNGGVFPVQRIAEIVDGRATIDSHGLREMPIWGVRYSDEGTSYTPYSQLNTEAFTQGRILALVEYINRLQVK
jgi:mono/diheme cytochrome c family protein